jgi:hypothetical protein
MLDVGFDRILRSLPEFRVIRHTSHLTISMLNGSRRVRTFALMFASVLAVAACAGSAITRPFMPVRGGHGCVNAGTDTRIDPFGLVCSLQRRYSYRSADEPKLHTHKTWAWGTRPFYFVYNRNLADGNWLLVRLGWRYDHNWGGYIGPSAAWKECPEPLLYY